jgi:hypothetical protein
MAGAEVTGTELYDQMSGETTDMTMRQGPDLFEETNFGGTLPAEEQPTIPAGGLPAIPSAEQPAPLEAPDLDIIDLGDFNTTPPRILKKFL